MFSVQSGSKSLLGQVFVAALVVVASVAFVKLLSFLDGSSREGGSSSAPATQLSGEVNDFAFLYRLRSEYPWMLGVLGDTVSQSDFDQVWIYAKLTEQLIERVKVLDDSDVLKAVNASEMRNLRTLRQISARDNVYFRQSVIDVLARELEVAEHSLSERRAKDLMPRAASVEFVDKLRAGNFPARKPLDTNP